MVERSDPGRAGVVAGRVVGVLTGAIAVAGLLRGDGTAYARFASALAAVGLGGDLAAPALFWGSAAVAVSTRYVACYVIGSLLGVLYDWLDRPPVASLFALSLLVGGADGFLAAVDTRSVAIGGLHVLAWLCYVPVFAWLLDDPEEESEPGERRLADL